MKAYAFLVVIPFLDKHPKDSDGPLCINSESHLFTAVPFVRLTYPIISDNLSTRIHHRLGRLGVDHQ